MAPRRTGLIFLSKKEHATMNYRELIEWCASTPNARELVHEITQETGKLTARGRKPTARELDALALLIEARADEEAQGATAAASDAYAARKAERDEKHADKIVQAKRLDNNAAAPA